MEITDNLYGYHSLVKLSIIVYIAEPRVEGGLVAASWKLDTLSTTDTCLFYMPLDFQKNAAIH